MATGCSGQANGSPVACSGSTGRVGGTTKHQGPHCLMTDFQESSMGDKNLGRPWPVSADAAVSADITSSSLTSKEEGLGRSWRSGADYWSCLVPQ